MTTAGRTALHVLALGLLGVALSTAAAATDAAELARCAAIAAADARLACYDALAGRVVNDNMLSSDHAAATTAPTAALAAAPSPAEAEQNFGLSAAQLHTLPQEPQAIQARIAQINQDQLRRSYVVLDNGQAWASSEGEMIVNTGELVTIKRAALGSFMLTSAQSKHSYHVRRIR